MELNRVEVQTVTGKIPVKDIGITLFHEHLFLDNTSAYRPALNANFTYLRDKKVSIEDLALLREFPYASLDNIKFDDVDGVIEELNHFVDQGGKTVVDVTGWNSGRVPENLVLVSQKTGLFIVMGCGLYRERSHPEWALEERVEDITDRIVKEITQGVSLEDGQKVFPGVIGEIGVSNEFTQQEKKSLRAAARAQVQTKLPLTIHLPGWQRLGHQVLDICEAEGVRPQSIVLDHMDPSCEDTDYQISLAKRGSFLEFDGIGMGLYLYQEKQGPSDDLIARAIVQLIHKGFGDQLLFSHDIYLKILWRKYGGNGYAHVLRSFIPRLVQLGLDESSCNLIMTKNPQQVFINAAAGNSLG